MPNLSAAAMGVLNDWRDGRVQGWIEVPVEVEEGEWSRREVKTVVKEWAREFRIEGLWGDGDEGEDKEKEDRMEGMEK